MDNELMKKTEALIKAVQDSPPYIKLKEAHKVITTDPALQAKIAAFNDAKTIYENTKKYGKHHPNLRAAQLELQRSKQALFMCPEIQTYKKYETQLQAHLDSIATKLGKTVSSTISIDTQFSLSSKGGSTCSNV